MRFRDMVGQSFRDATGMPPKVSVYNSRLKVYDGISDDVSEVENLTIQYFRETSNIDCNMVNAKRIKFDSDLQRGLISINDYVEALNLLDQEREIVINDFVSSSSDYFIAAYRNKLYSVKKRYSRDPYISPMEFDTWFHMKEARELAKLAALQIRSSDEYVDAKKIAEISERYKRDRHLRRGR